MFSKIKARAYFRTWFQKYATVVSISWSNGFAYPVSFWMWRARQLLQTFISLSLWVAVFAATQSAFGYAKDQMLTYIFLANIINYSILSSRTIDIVNVINSGDLSLYLVKPVNFFVYWFSRDIADKLQNIIFSVVELVLLYLIFRPTLFVLTNPIMILVFLFAIVFGTLLYFFINATFGFIGFWSPDVWAPRFLFFMIMSFTAGTFFPLDIFPATVVHIFSYTPFPYLTFFQTKIWLNQLTTNEILFGMMMMSAWTLAMFLLMKTLWKKGIRGYGSEGR